MNDVMSFLPALAIAAACCIALNVLVTLPALRVAGDYFVVTSFGIQLLATAVFTNWTGGTGGANGLPGIPPPDLFGYSLDETSQVVSLCLAGMALRLPYLLVGHARPVWAPVARHPGRRAGGRGGGQECIARKGIGRGTCRSLRAVKQGALYATFLPELHRPGIVV